MISVIVSIYKRLDKLHLIFLSLDRQTYKNFEVIVSEDNNAPEVVDFITRMRATFKFPIKHVSQEDIGFRKTRILNQAALAASGEYLVFLDGDCVPHKRWLESYAKELTPNNVCLGRRCYINRKLTEKALDLKCVQVFSFFNILFNARHLDHAFYIPFLKQENSTRLIGGCNWATHKQNIVDINGFDEDYNKPGVGEDHDIDWRLRKLNLNFVNIKHKVIVYHLFHESHYGDSEINIMEAMEVRKKQIGDFVCKNGIKKLH